MTTIIPIFLVKRLFWRGEAPRPTVAYAANNTKPLILQVFCKVGSVTPPLKYNFQLYHPKR